LEIFGIGLPELVMILVVALIVLGPDRLPEAARGVGKTIADVRRATEPARTAWAELTSEVNTVVTSATTQVTGGKSGGNPWEVHPILAKMTPEEREAYIAGGEMPAHVAEELDKMSLTSAPTLNGNSDHLPALEYPIPHEGPRVASKGRIEEIYYPEPGSTGRNKSTEEEQPL
jgi:Tat protein translocase TatB subunit